MVKYLNYLTIILLTSLTPLAVSAAPGYDKAIGDGVLSLLKEIKYLGKLQGKLIAVSGFHDAFTEAGPKELSVFLANQVDGEINRLKTLMTLNFRTVPRHSVDSIETEFMLSKGNSLPNIISLLGKADILVTGAWQNHENTLNLVLKGVALNWSGIEELSSVEIKFSKDGLPKKIRTLLVLENDPVSFVNQPGKSDWKYRINLQSARVNDHAPGGADDGNPAPDTYIVIKDTAGSTLFHSGHYYRNHCDLKSLCRNRNNYNPDFSGSYCCHDFSRSPELVIYLYDSDGLEGAFNRKKSRDDMIGTPYRFEAADVSEGRHLLVSEHWSLEVVCEKLK